MGELTIVTLNIWNRFGPWEERLPRIQRGLLALDADIVGLQEVLVMKEPAFDQAALVGQGLGYHAVWGHHSKSPYPAGNAILSRFPVKEQAILDLPQCGTDEHRVVVFARVESPYGLIPVFCTHLNWRLDEGHIRVEQVKALVGIIHEKAPKSDFPAIVMGDFNAEPDSDEIRYLRGLTGLGGKCVHFTDCFAAATDGAPGYTFARENPFAAVCHEPNRRIDYVFTHGPDDRGRGEPLAAKVCMNQTDAGGFPSDHFGVWTKITA